MTPICVTMPLDCRLTGDCQRHKSHHAPSSADQTYSACLGDRAVFACPGYLPPDDDGFVTLYMSAGATA